MERTCEQLPWLDRRSIPTANNTTLLRKLLALVHCGLIRRREEFCEVSGVRKPNRPLQARKGLRPQLVMWLATFLLLALSTAKAQTPPEWTITCGGEGQPVCAAGEGLNGVYYDQQNAPTASLDNFQIYAPYFFTKVQCDFALAPDANGNCSNPPPGSIGLGGRRSIIGTTLNTRWIDFAMKQQRYAIQADQAMNWITIFGTHNSFSNYQDGAFDDSLFGFNFNVDQKWSITDQLDAGARYIRIDPVSYDVHYEGPSHHGDNYQLRMCHQSASSLLLTSAECDFTSYGRLFAYAVDEVRNWLDNHPDEVLVLRMNRTEPQDLAAIDAALDSNMQSKGNYILVPPGNGNANSWDPTDQGWPTLREMRAMNKRLIILSDKGTPQFSYPWSWVVNDGYSDAENIDLWTGTRSLKLDGCENQDGLDVRTRAFNQWSYIGEDRSGSNAIEDGTYNLLQGGKGLLNAPEVKTATNCAFGLVNVDFLLAGQYAPKLAKGFSFDLGAGGTYGIDSFNYKFGEDLRREAAIWSWDDGEMGLLGPAFMKPSGRWGSASPEDAHPFACAVGRGFVGNPVNYSWIISQTSGPWRDGPQVCKAAGGAFWAPQSALENMNLKASANGQQVWINYMASGKPILEPVSPELTYADGVQENSAGAFVVTLIQGKPYGPESPNFQYTGGVGGPLKVTIDPVAAPLLSSGLKIDTSTKTIYLNFAKTVHDSQGHVSLPLGAYTQTFTVGEEQGGGHNNQTYSLIINVVPDPTANITVASTIAAEQISVDGITVTSPHTFTWVVGSQHSIASPAKVVAPGTEWIFNQWSDSAPNPSRTYTVPKNDSTIVVQYNEFFMLTLAPASHGALTVSPRLGNGFMHAGSNVTVTATANDGYYFAGYAGQVVSPSNPVTFQINVPTTVTATFAPNPKVVVDSQIAGEAMTVDGVSVTAPHSYYWAPGSVHTMDCHYANNTPGYKAVFSSWSDGNTHQSRVFNTPLQGGRILAQFQQYFRVTLTATTNGTLAVSPASPIGGGFYLPGSPVTFTASPASGYRFTGFTGNAISNVVNPRTVAIGRPITVGANFAPIN